MLLDLKNLHPLSLVESKGAITTRNKHIITALSASTQSLASARCLHIDLDTLNEVSLGSNP